MSNQISGVFYALKCAGDVEPPNFLAELSKKIAESPERDQPKRTGQFSRVRVFRNGRWYLLLVEGNMRRLRWLVSLLETYGEVSFPLDEDTWSWETDIGRD